MQRFNHNEGRCVHACGRGRHGRNLGLHRPQVGACQADIYTDAIRDVCHELASETKQGRPVEVWPDFKKYLCGSHLVYFFEDASRLNVIRILHQRQDVERHL